MNQKLMDEGVTAEKAAFYREEKVEAVLRVAIEKCVGAATDIEQNALNQLKGGELDPLEAARQQGRGLAATVIRQRIEKLLK